MIRWDHQDKLAEEFWRLIEAGPQGPICVTSPTGGGKTVMACDLIVEAGTRGQKTVLYSDRKLLTEQLESNLKQQGIEHGVMAANWIPVLERDVQIASIQTTHSRVYRKKEWELHDAKLVIVDEAHKNAGEVATRIIQDHVARGAIVAGFTATPLDIGHIYRHLLVAGTNSELRKCGALLPCHTFAPDEPDARSLKPTPTGEYTENQVRKVIMTPTIFGRVYDWWKKLNPDARPAILFAPGVAESLWFAKQFEENGVRAGHIDGETVYFDGETYESDKHARETVIRMVKAGELKVLCNRFVLREGIDIPELSHCIMATIFGSLQSYLQSGGRLLRYHPSLPDHVVLQDHGGNWWRHGSLNDDREWRLEYNATIVNGLRAQNFREKKSPQPLVCPKCAATRRQGKACHACGFIAEGRTRMVVQKNGDLKPMTGDIFKPRRIVEKPNTWDRWQRMYYRAKKSGMTFTQAEALMAVESGDWSWPPRTLAMMPVNDLDWFLPVASVPKERLR